MNKDRTDTYRSIIKVLVKKSKQSADPVEIVMAHNDVHRHLKLLGFHKFPYWNVAHVQVPIHSIYASIYD